MILLRRVLAIGKQKLHCAVTNPCWPCWLRFSSESFRSKVTSPSSIFCPCPPVDIAALRLRLFQLCKELGSFVGHFVHMFLKGRDIIFNVVYVCVEFRDFRADALFNPRKRPLFVKAPVGLVMSLFCYEIRETSMKHDAYIVRSDVIAQFNNRIVLGVHRCNG